MVIVWADQPKKELQKAFVYISSDSYQNAINVKNDIIDHIQLLLQFPENHPIDKYKTFKSQIRIMRLRHTSRSPKKY